MGSPDKCFWSPFLGASAEMRKATINVVNVRLSVRPHGTARLPLDGFSWNLIFEDVAKTYVENSRFIEIGQEWRVLYMKTGGPR